MKTMPPNFTAILLALICICDLGRAASDENEFTPLFTGRDLSGWRVLNAKKVTWKATPDRLVVNSWTKGKPSSDLATEENFWNFTLRFDYLVHQGGNSGVYLRGCYEIQLIDDDSARNLSAVSNGAIYNQRAPSVFASKPSGEWQTMEVTIIGNQISVTLNGKLIHDRVPCRGPTGQAVNTNVNAPGPILLQGRLGDVKFRNMRIKKLPN